MIMMKKRMFLKLMAVAMLLLTAMQAVAQKEFYGVSSYNNGNETWTYYYDTQKASRGGVSSPGNGLLNTSNTVTVVFDASVADYKPTSMTGWFSNCSELTTITGLQYLNTSNVWMMNMMFMGCSKLKSVDLSHFDTSKVTTMVAMFEGCSSLTKLDLTSFDTSNVTDMEGMFAYCSSLTIVDLSSFNTAKVTNMSGMFAYCEVLRTIYADDARWSIAAVTNGSDVFCECGPLVGGNGTKYYDTYIENVSYARVDKAGQPGYFTQKDGPALPTPEPYAVLSEENTVLTFYYDGKKEKRGGLSVGPFAFDEVHWGGHHKDITTVVFDKSFANCTSITSMYCWFQRCNNLTTINGIENLNTSNVTNMGSMFQYCYNLESIDLSHFDTKNLTDISQMFSLCKKMKALDMSNFNTSKIYSAFSVFYGCEKLESVDLSNWDTSSFKYTYDMFRYCYALTNIDVTHFDTKNVTHMGWMFANCTHLTSLDVSSFDVSKVIDARGMFSYCSGLTNIYCDDTWNVSGESNDMFYGCTQLTGFSSANANDVTFAKPIADGGYFTPKNGGLTKCAKPVIHYAYGELSFSCETEGVEYVYSYSSPEVSVPETVGNNVELPMTYTVTVFARKEGMEDSEKVTQDIDVSDGLKGDVDGDGVVDIADAVRIVNFIVGKIQTLAPRFEWNLPEPE